MSATPISHLSSILAVVVLYNRELSQSQSVSSLLQILKENPGLAQHFSLILYDNSPQPQSHAIEAGLPICYAHDPGNGGLAPAYNFALQRAEADGYKWLLLLDQDTSPTREFLLELVETTGNLDTRSGVAAIVPKLLVKGEVHSPAASFIHQLRRQFLPRQQAMRQDVVGVQQQHMSAYNSGSTLRVSALRSIGGFPAEFWLDFLDHAVFHALFVNGYRIYVMQAALAHDFSHTEIEAVPAWRQHNVLQARTLYLEQRGNFIDRLLYRIWLLRHARKLRQSGKHLRIWKETALQALRPLGANHPSAARRGDIEER